MYRHDGICLDRESIAFNPGLRTVAKQILNNLWGKLSQKAVQTQKEFVTSPRRFLDLWNREGVEVNELLPVNEDCIFMTHKMSSKGFESPSPNTNPVIAAYVTAHARLVLYEYLERLGERALYYDTDSVIFMYAPEDYVPPIGRCLGDMTDELGSGDHITQFVSLGPKNYAYRTVKGGKVVKVKGFTLNYHASKYITFDTMLDMVKEVDELGRGRSIVVVNEPRKIIRNVKRRLLLTRSFDKRYMLNFDKRVVKPGFLTYPYGYK